MLFSASPFPGTSSAYRGNELTEAVILLLARSHMEGWLCPALLKYFDQAPRELYFQVKPKPATSNPTTPATSWIHCAVYGITVPPRRLEFG